MPIDPRQVKALINEYLDLEIFQISSSVNPQDAQTFWEGLSSDSIYPLKG